MARTMPDERDEEQAEKLNQRRAESEPSDMHRLFAKYIKDETGYDPDLDTVKLVTMMRQDFRKSQVYREFREEQEAARNGDDEEEEKPKKKSSGKKKSAASASSKSKSSTKSSGGSKKKTSGGSRRKKAEEALDDDD